MSQLTKEYIDLQNTVFKIRSEIESELKEGLNPSEKKERLESYYRAAPDRISALILIAEKLLAENEQLAGRQGWTCPRCGARNVRIPVVEPKIIPAAGANSDPRSLEPI